MCFTLLGMQMAILTSLPWVDSHSRLHSRDASRGASAPHAVEVELGTLLCVLYAHYNCAKCRKLTVVVVETANWVLPTLQ